MEQINSKQAIKDLRYNVSMSQDLEYTENNNLCDIVEKDLDILYLLKEKEVDIDYICWNKLVTNNNNVLLLGSYNQTHVHPLKLKELETLLKWLNKE